MRTQQRLQLLERRRREGMVRWIFPPPVVFLPMRDLGLILTHVAVQCPPLTGSLGVRRPIPFFLAPGPSRRGLC